MRVSPGGQAPNRPNAPSGGDNMLGARLAD